jgi:hypothetical protein
MTHRLLACCHPPHATCQTGGARGTAAGAPLSPSTRSAGRGSGEQVAVQQLVEAVHGRLHARRIPAWRTASLQQGRVGPTAINALMRVHGRRQPSDTGAAGATFVGFLGRVRVLKRPHRPEPYAGEPKPR